MGNHGQDICERFWGDITNIENFMELEINQTRRKTKKPQEWRNDDPSQVQIAEAWTPPKSAGELAGEGRWHVIATHKNDVLQFR